MTKATDSYCGLRKRYQQGCRCELCTVANATYQRLYESIRKRQGRPVIRKRNLKRFGNGSIYTVKKSGEMVVGIKGKGVVARATPYALASRMIEEGTLAKSFHKLR